MSTSVAVHHIDIQGEHEKFFAFVNLALFMAAITGMELVIIFIPFPVWIVITAIIVLSAVKFLGVIFWFMHLIYDKLFCTVLFMIGLILAGGTATALLFLLNDGRAIPLDELSSVSSISASVSTV